MFRVKKYFGQGMVPVADCARLLERSDRKSRGVSQVLEKHCVYTELTVSGAVDEQIDTTLHFKGYGSQQLQLLIPAAVLEGCGDIITPVEFGSEAGLITRIPRQKHSRGLKTGCRSSRDLELSHPHTHIGDFA